MKSKSSDTPQTDSENRRTASQESPAVRNKVSNKTSNGKRNGSHGISAPSKPNVTGPGRTPQTKRREFSVPQNEKNLSNVSPRSRESEKPQARASNQNRSKNETSKGDPTRKSSCSSQDSGIGRDIKPNRQEQTKSAQSVSKTKTNPVICTVSAETVELEVSNRKKFEDLCDVKNVEMGIVKVSPETLQDLIHKGNIETYYDVDPIPVASGLFATVKKCTNKETGVEYAAKFSSRVRYGVDCTSEVLHEIALLSICVESSKIVHLKDVFQSKHEIVLVLEYAPGGDFQSVLDDDMVPFEQDVQGFILQILEALQYIHLRKIAHLDIKPQNIVLMSEFPNCEIKLCDLEVSRVIQSSEQIREIIGTPDYVAPEILAMEPITLAADIWSLGVVAYVLLTGFSPFGGDSDQETLRNISTASLDFPAELFEGVSEDAKDFISRCLNRNPKKRPSVDECLQHPWISQNDEPPSPSPLMLKIPALDHFLSPYSGGENYSGSSRRSCQTCRDKITERKRYLSKSREAIFEKVANSNLKKSLSKSRERLCDMRLTLSKSRDYLNESKIASRSQEKLVGYKSFSKSQEVLSPLLVEKNSRHRVNGAFSDITHLPNIPKINIATLANCDYVDLPRSSETKSSLDSTNLSPIRTPESGTSTTGFLFSSQTLQSDSQIENNANSKKGKHPETLHEVSDEDLEDIETFEKVSPPTGLVYTDAMCLNDKKSEAKTNRRKSCNDTLNSRAFIAKDEKNNRNYETKHSMIRSSSADGINNMSKKNSISNPTLHSRSNTSEIAVQVDLINSNSFLNVVRKDNKVKPELTFGQEDANIRPDPVNKEIKMRQVFLNDENGEESKRHSWREELEKFRAKKKSLGVSDLIDTFTKNSGSRKSFVESSFLSDLDQLKMKRRGSLQLQINPEELTALTDQGRADKISGLDAKPHRRRSTSYVLSPIVTSNINENIVTQNQKQAEVNVRKIDKPAKDIQEHEEKKEKDEIEKKEKKTHPAEDLAINKNKGLLYLEEVNQRKRTWDYFEINHPKAISDVKLEQLKSKYNRRKTEINLKVESEEKKESSSKETPKVKSVPIPSRTISVPVIKGLSKIHSENLDLAWDPLTGESVDNKEVSVNSGTQDNIINDTESVSEKIASEIVPENPALKNESLDKHNNPEKIIPDQKVLECFIDPFTGQFIMNQVLKRNANDSNCDDAVNANNVMNLFCNKSGQKDSDQQNTPADKIKKKMQTVYRFSKSEFADDFKDKQYPTPDKYRAGIITDPSDNTLDRFSTISIEESSNSDCMDSNLGLKGPDILLPAFRPRSFSASKERSKDTKVCTGSYSRGMGRFRSESPAEST